MNGEARELILKVHDEVRMARDARKRHLLKKHGDRALELLNDLMRLTPPGRETIPETAAHPDLLSAAIDLRMQLRTAATTAVEIERIARG